MGEHFFTVFMVSCSSHDFTCEDFYLYFDLFHMYVKKTVSTHIFTFSQKALHAKPQLVGKKMWFTTVPGKTTWDWSWKDFFTSFNPIFCSPEKSLNVINNTINALPLSQNNWWNPQSKLFQVGSGLAHLLRSNSFLSWQLTHSGLPKVYLRNRKKDQIWSKNLRPSDSEHVLHIHTAHMEGFIIPHLILPPWCL